LTTDLTPLAAPGLAALAGIGLGVLAHAYLAPTSRAFLPMVSRADAHNNTVALTFDDGPHPTGTPAILDILAEHHVLAAFFVIGENARRHPDLIRRMHAEGHLVCNHSFDHASLGSLRGPAYWLDQLRRTDNAIHDAVGLTPACFRPPWGQKSPLMRAPLNGLGKTPIGWTRRAFDGLPTTPVRILQRLSNTRAGDVLLLHDGCPPHAHRDPAPTIAALPQLIQHIRARGLTLARLDEHLKVPAYSRMPTGVPAGAAS